MKEKLVTQLREALAERGHRGRLTVADAAQILGRPLRDAQAALFGLMSEHPAKLTTTDEGVLVFDFPDGVTKRRDERGFFRKLWDGAKKVVKGVGRFVLRAWITIAIFGYVLIFGAILLALALKSEDGIGGLGELLFVLVRVALEAAFWMFHPFSPYAHARSEQRFVRSNHKYDMRTGKKLKDKTPFYEKVNRFVFGPEEESIDPEQRERMLLMEIREQKGRIGVSDIMRLTGVERAEADAVIAKLMLDYDGEAEVSDDGGIIYHFPRVRYAGQQQRKTYRPNVWDRLKELPALTGGNTAGSNLLIGGLNVFNLVASFVALTGGWTIEKISLLIEGVPPELWPTDMGTAWALGVIPFFFSAWILAMPIWRAIKRIFERGEVQAENGRRGLLKRVLERLQGATADDVSFSESELKAAFASVAGREPKSSEVSAQLLELGAELESASEDQVPRWRFVDLEAEVKALQEERAKADERVNVGQAVYEVES